MDLRQYYLAIQQAEKTIQGDAVVVVSTATEDGGRAGILSEVTRHAAARMVVEGKAVLATEMQKTHFALWRKGPPEYTKLHTTDSEASTHNSLASAVNRPRKR